MEKNTAELIKYIMGGIGMLIFIGMLSWCYIEEMKIKNHTTNSCEICDCEKNNVYKR